MENPKSNWSELCIDILRVLLERLSFVDFHRAKTVCRNWYMCSKQTVRPRSGSPWLMMQSSDNDHVLLNPEEDRVYKTKRDCSGTRFLANSGNWFLALDSKSNLYIEHVFNEKKRINLPPLESMKSDLYSLKRVRDKEFNENGSACFPEKGFNKSLEDLRGVLWVEEDVEGKEQEYTVAWFFDQGAEYIAFCKNGDDYYRTVSTRLGVHYTSQGIFDMVLQGDILYVYTTRKYLRLLDLSGHESCKEVHRRCFILPFLPANPQSGEDMLKVSYNIAVTRSGEVLLVESIVYKATSSDIMPRRMFHVYKTDPNPDSEDILHSENLSFEVDSLGDEAILLDSGITVPAALGILQPNSIYFTRHDRVRNFAQEPSSPDICVFNLETKKLTRFPIISSKDALWFLPS